VCIFSGQGMQATTLMYGSIAITPKPQCPEQVIPNSKLNWSSVHILKNNHSKVNPPVLFSHPFLIVRTGINGNL